MILKRQEIILCLSSGVQQP